MKITFLGAAQTVTGSCYVIETTSSRFAVDCGMFQGNSAIEERNFETEDYRPEELDFILLTHAHIDHSGLLPRMVKEGFKGGIYCTAPTADLAAIMLELPGLSASAAEIERVIEVMPGIVSELRKISPFASFLKK